MCTVCVTKTLCKGLGNNPKEGGGEVIEHSTYFNMNKEIRQIDNLEDWTNK